MTDRVSQVSLASLCETDPMTISGVVERLEAKGLIQREADPDDSRAKIVFITDKARALVNEMKMLAEDVYAEAFGKDISEGDRATTPAGPDGNERQPVRDSALQVGKNWRMNARVSPPRRRRSPKS